MAARAATPGCGSCFRPTGRYTVQARSLGDEAGDYTLKLTEYGPAGPPPAPVALSRGDPVQGRLSFEDVGLQAGTDDSGAITYFYRLYALPMRAGETVTVDMKASDFDPVLDAGVMSPLGFAVGQDQRRYATGPIRGWF